MKKLLTIFFISILSFGKGQIDYKGLDTAKAALLIWNMDSVGFKPLLAYEVREKYCCKNGHPEGFGAFYPVPFYEHLYYLDKDKMPLPKNIIVWDSKTIE